MDKPAIRHKDLPDTNGQWLFEQTRVTPLIVIDSQKGFLEIKGNSNPESALEFYDSIFKILDALGDKPPKVFQANIALDYFNTSSVRCIFIVIKKLARFKNNGAKVVINWYYEEDDEDMLDSGKDFEDLVQVDFRYIPY